jgi:crotonobetainyl-CoA:carnitine CoA-transferase CaiB-like acyl-CoA transferase
MQSKNAPHMKHRDIWVESDGFTQAMPAPRFGDSANQSIGRIPKRGEHRKEILSELSEDKF